MATGPKVREVERGHLRRLGGAWDVDCVSKSQMAVTINVVLVFAALLSSARDAIVRCALFGS